MAKDGPSIFTFARLFHIACLNQEELRILERGVDLIVCQGQEDDDHDKAKELRDLISPMLESKGEK